MIIPLALTLSPTFWLVRMALVRERHAQLHGVVASLSEKVRTHHNGCSPWQYQHSLSLLASQISAVLGRQEKDFLAAYRAHMYNVQKELHDMREKMYRNETVENKSEKIKKIEDERDWYRKEALRLDAFTTTMTKDLKFMKEKLEAIEQDRNWLEKQLKACKKQNKLLRAELDVRVASSANTGGLDAVMLPAFDLAQSKADVRKQLKRHSDSTDPGNLPCLNLDKVSPMLVEEREDKYKKQIRTLKKDLQQKTQELNMLSRQRALGTEDENRAHLENFFLQCLESVKEEVKRRRSGSFEGKEDRNAAVQRRSHAANKARNQRYDVGQEFEDFSSTDRVRLIERLLAHDEVLTFLYQHLFPSTPPDGQQRSDRSGTPGFIQSSSAQSLPDMSSRKQAPEPEQPADADLSSSDAGARAGQPVGSGAAVASAARGGGLLLDDFTKDYLRSMYVMTCGGWDLYVYLTDANGALNVGGHPLSLYALLQSNFQCHTLIWPLDSSISIAVASFSISTEPISSQLYIRRVGLAS